MRYHSLAAPLLVAALALPLGQAVGQAGPEAPPARREAIPHGQAAKLEGIVQRVLLTPRGDVDGLLLENGTQIHTAPHLSTQVAYALRVGDQVQIEGRQAGVETPVEALRLTNPRSGLTVVSEPPSPPSGTVDRLTDLVTGGPKRPEPEPTSLVGKIQTTLRAPRGEIAGAVLDDGTIVRVGPDEAEKLGRLLVPGNEVEIEGGSIATVMGRVIAAQKVTVRR